MIVGKDIDDEIIKSLKDKRIAIITDTTVNKIAAKIIQKITKANGAELVVLKSGEAVKIRKTKEIIEDRLLSKKYGRDSLMVAIGGGVIGDIAGFVAATYYRGIDIIQIPTTLLAMVDSSIGGKTAVNTIHGKNLIGAFHMPKEVFIDVNYLKTLPDEEFLNGLSEAAKYAIACDKELFFFLEKYKNEIVKKEEDYLVYMIKRCVNIKEGIVKKDPHDNSIRIILNFGHTIGHAIETASNYKEKHGTCVAMGMYAEALISKKLGLLEEHEYIRIIGLMKDLNLLKKRRIFPEKIISAMQYDKKVASGAIRMVLLEGIGKAHLKDGKYSHEVENKLTREALSCLS